MRSQNDNSNNTYQADSAVAFVNMATISPSTHQLPSNPLVDIPQLTNYLFTECTQNSSI